MRAGFKPSKVEEPIDYWVHRPIAGLLVALVLPLPVTPNQVTVASGVAGLCAGVLVGVGSVRGPGWVLAGGFVVLVSVVLDCADGQLARLRGSSSLLGRALDGFMDMAVPTSVFLGWGLYLLSRGYSFWTSWPVGLAAAASLAWHAAQYDAAKNVYLHCSRSAERPGGSVLLAVTDLEQLRRRYEARGEGFHAVLMRIWRRWTLSQARAVSPWLGSRAPQDSRERALFARLFRRDMQRWSWLGFGTHMMLVQWMCWLTPWSDLAIWIGWAIMLGPMNAYCPVLLGRRRRLLERYQAELDVLRACRHCRPPASAPAAARFLFER